VDSARDHAAALPAVREPAVSKASAWADEARRAKPASWNGQTYAAQMLPQATVNDQGDLTITDGMGRVQIWRGEAVALARWILETFGDEP
jgi:hypothetical protein